MSVPHIVVTQSTTADSIAKTTWSDQRMKQYPPPPFQPKQSDYNQNEVQMDAVMLNGGRVFDSTPTPPKPAARRGSTGFSPFGGMYKPPLNNCFCFTY